MRIRSRIGTIMIGIAAIAVGLAWFVEWRKGSPPGPSMALRIARGVLAERSARPSTGRSTFDSSTIAAFVGAALLGSKAVRAIAVRRRNR